MHEHTRPTRTHSNSREHILIHCCVCQLCLELSRLESKLLRSRMVIEVSSLAYAVRPVAVAVSATMVYILIDLVKNQALPSDPQVLETFS